MMLEHQAAFSSILSDVFEPIMAESTQSNEAVDMVGFRVREFIGNSI